MGAETAASTARSAATRPVPQAAIRAVADTLHDSGTDPGSPEATGGEVSFLRARMANKVLKAQTAKVRLEKMKAEVIDRARATAMVFDPARRDRDAWLEQPPQLAATNAQRSSFDAGVHPFGRVHLGKRLFVGSVAHHAANVEQNPRQQLAVMRQKLRRAKVDRGNARLERRVFG